MSSRFGNGGRMVPMRVARQLLEQRDQLVEEVQRARRERDEIQAEMRNTAIQRDQLRRQLESAREDIEQFKSSDEESTSQPEQTPEDEGPPQAEVLQLRVERLTQDLERIRRRTSDEIIDARREERIRLLSGLGDVLDAVDRALAFGDDKGPWRQGLEAIRSQLLAFFRGEGASIVGEVGQKVDPKIHHAVDRIDSADHRSGQVARVDRVGIVLEDGTVVRPAQVAVAR